MRTKSWLVSGLAMMALALAAPAIVYGHGHWYHKRAEGKTCPRMESRLNLSSDQLAKINSLHRQFFKDTAPVREDLMKERDQLWELTHSDNWDQAKIDAAADQISQLGNKLMKDRLALLGQIRGLLTPDQQALFDSENGRMAWGWGGGFHGYPDMMPRRGRGCGCGYGRGMGPMAWPDRESGFENPARAVNPGMESWTL
jgi:Spy/CpxP family protein refolding chaperone